MVRVNIILRTGTEAALHQAGMIAVGASSVDHPIRIFIMDDALAAVLRHYKGEKIANGYEFEEVRDGFHKAEESGKTMTWEELLESAKDLSEEVEIMACGLALDVMGYNHEELPDLFDKVSGVADFVGGLEDDDIVFTL